jgi:ribosomal protein S26
MADVPMKYLPKTKLEYSEAFNSISKITKFRSRKTRQNRTDYWNKKE